MTRYRVFCLQGELADQGRQAYVLTDRPNFPCRNSASFVISICS